MVLRLSSIYFVVWMDHAFKFIHLSVVSYIWLLQIVLQWAMGVLIMSEDLISALLD